MDKNTAQIALEMATGLAVSGRIAPDKIVDHAEAFREFLEDHKSSF